MSRSGIVKEGENIERRNVERGAIKSVDTVQRAPEKEKKLSENGQSDNEVNKTTYMEPIEDEKIDAMIDKLRTMVANSIFPSYFWNNSLADLTKRLGALARKTGKTLEGYKNLHKCIFECFLFFSKCISKVTIF